MTSERPSRKEKSPETSTRRSSTRTSRRSLAFRFIERMSISAFMMGLSIVLARFCSFYVPLGGMPSMRVSLGNLPIIITSLTCGPIWGMLVGAGSDLIGAIAFPVGAYFFGYTIDSALSGLFPWIVDKLLHGRRKIESVYAVCLNALALILAISYLFTHTTYTNGKPTFNYEFELTTPVRFGISGLLILLAAISFGIIMVIQGNSNNDERMLREFSKIKSLNGIYSTEKKDVDGYSILDIYVIFQTSALLVTVLLLPYWNSLVMSLPYFYGIFNNLIFMWLEGPIKVIIYWMVLRELKKAKLMEIGRLRTRSYSNATSA